MERDPPTTPAGPAPLTDEPSLGAMLDALAASGLREDRDLPSAPLAPDVWQALLDGAGRCRLTPTLVAELRQGRIAAAPGQLGEGGAARMRARANVRRFEALLVDVSSAFASAGVEHRLLK